MAGLPLSLASWVCCRASMLAGSMAPTCKPHQHMCRFPFRVKWVQSAQAPSPIPSKGAAEGDTQVELSLWKPDPQPAACAQDSCKQPTASSDACGLQTPLLRMHRRPHADVALPQGPKMLTLSVRERSPETSCTPSTQEVTLAWLEQLLLASIKSQSSWAASAGHCQTRSCLQVDSLWPPALAPLQQCPVCRA